jgi:hypothetical protein
MTDSERQAILDEEHLRLLRIAYIILGITNGVISLFALFYVAMGSLVGSEMARTMPNRPGQPDVRIVGYVMMVFGGVLFGFLAGGAALKLFAAHSLRLRRHRTFCQIAAAVTCIEVPFGTILGIATFQVLGRPSVAALFGAYVNYPPYPLIPPQPPPMPPPPAAPRI